VDSARRRLARLVCADEETLPAGAIDEIAGYIHSRQVDLICGGIGQVLSRLPSLRRHPAVILGSGAFLAEAAAKNMGLKIQNRPAGWQKEELAVAPCLAAARLLAEKLEP
jgi:uncharacterized hydantoinase/oxoprolinase family protein